MSAARAAALTGLRASRPRPAVAGHPVEAFAARLARQGGRCARLQSIAELPAWMRANFAAGSDGLPGLVVAGDESLQGLFGNAAASASNRLPAPLALTTAFAAIAETGSVVVHPRAGAPMAMNFLPDRLVVVIRREHVVANLEDFWMRVRERFGTNWPRALCLVSGPSSSGDIGMQFATGVHGPIELHVVVIGPETDRPSG